MGRPFAIRLGEPLIPIRDARVCVSILDIVARHQCQNKGVAAMAATFAACVVKGSAAGTLGHSADLVIAAIVLIIIGFIPRAAGDLTEVSQPGRQSALPRHERPRRFTSRHHR